MDSRMVVLSSVGLVSPSSTPRWWWRMGVLVVVLDILRLGERGGETALFCEQQPPPTTTTTGGSSLTFVHGLSAPLSRPPASTPSTASSSSSSNLLSRRDVLITTAGVGTAAATTTVQSNAGIMVPNKASASALDDDNGPPRNDTPRSPLLSSSLSSSSSFRIPRVGYSLYNTPQEQVTRCVEVALRSGVQYFDFGTQYGTNREVGHAIAQYIQRGPTQLAVQPAKATKTNTNTKKKDKAYPELLPLMDASYHYTHEQITKYDNHDNNEKRSLLLKGSTARTTQQQRRREELFLSHKISNAEQATDPRQIQAGVQTALDAMQLDYFDLVSIHSPLTTKEKRLTTYKALLEVQHTTNSIRAGIGVCNYGIAPLQEILEAGLPLPRMNQLELSPFNQHRAVVQFCKKHEIVVGCAAWSKLSNPDTGPIKEWNIVGELAKKNNITKAQLLVQWSVQSGYCCVPRSSSTVKLERTAIIENSYGGTSILYKQQEESIDTDDGTTVTKSVILPRPNFQAAPLVLSDNEMTLLNGLDVQWPAGTLRRTDGWTESDILNSKWDPTTAV